MTTAATMAFLATACELMIDLLHVLEALQFLRLESDSPDIKLDEGSCVFCIGLGRGRAVILSSLSMEEPGS